MISEETIKTHREALLAPLKAWILSVGPWKVVRYSGLSRRRLNNLLYRPQFDYRTFFNDFIILYAAYMESERVKKGQNYGMETVHNSGRFRLRSSSKK